MSNREYFVVGFEYGEPVKGITVFLQDLFNLKNDSSEIDITLAEQLDSHILDLKVGETAHIDLIRDHKQSKGVILRVK